MSYLQSSISVTSLQKLARVILKPSRAKYLVIETIVRKLYYANVFALKINLRNPCLPLLCNEETINISFIIFNELNSIKA